ncbi:DNA-binding transcriptional regulator, MarR family [Bacteroidales bacterium WCE2008]|nr:MarR family transcriptional regulator [Bacteroidales bacterium]MBR6363020.1 MarR family transcriptional regulator [Bacteroidales bacterium]SKC34695.1 DNA-binding transcriptional regulator, MarR family [Bacteroidales bacterium WCE2008]
MYNQLRLDKQLCFRFYTVSRLMTQTYHPMLEELGITYPQYLVLMVLWEKDAQPVNDIAKRLFLNTNTVTPLLKRMEEEGIISRRKDKTDERKVIVSLTAKGREMEETAKGIPARMQKACIDGTVSEEEMEQLYPILDTLINKLK